MEFCPWRGKPREETPGHLEPAGVERRPHSDVWPELPDRTGSPLWTGVGVGQAAGGTGLGVGEDTVVGPAMLGHQGEAEKPPAGDQGACDLQARGQSRQRTVSRRHRSLPMLAPVSSLQPLSLLKGGRVPYLPGTPSPGPGPAVGHQPPCAAGRS